jgi:hypothetical protein
MSIGTYLDRRRRNADIVRNAQVVGHAVIAEQDWGKSFRSRPGSADWKAHCECGWSSSAWHYGETEALASALPHIKKMQGATTS